MAGESSVFNYGIDQLTVGIALSLAKGNQKGILTPLCIAKIKASSDIVDHIAKGDEAVYGINTGFGPLCSTRISIEETSTLQHNILKSHSVGVGENVPPLIAKLMLILKVHALAQGHSGVSMKILERICWHIDQDIIPLVPSQGSVGASGDLAPLAHLFLPLIGLGQVMYNGRIVETKKMMRHEQIDGLQLQAKEGLGLINGTQFILAHAVVIIDQMHACLSHADIIGALMIEGLLGSPAPFISSLHELRPYPGNQHVAHRIAMMLEGSEIVDSHHDCDRVQDPYSLRCMPQVHGASRTAWLHLKEITEIELNSVTDNPVIINKDLAISGGNFHGQPLAMPLDYICLAASELGNISDRRTYLSLKGVHPKVPKLLMKETGTNSAFMMLQYTGAAIASENKTMCFPASADSIPTSLGQEDHVSMGSISGRKALKVIENVEKILAIELICAAQAVDYHRPLKSTSIMEKIHNMIRSVISHVEEDRVFSDDINAAIHLIKSRKLLSCLSSFNEVVTTPFEQQFEIY